MLKANIENKRGNAEQAMEYYGKVIDVNPFSKEALENRALLRKQAAMPRAPRAMRNVSTRYCLVSRKRGPAGNRVKGEGKLQQYQSLGI